MDWSDFVNFVCETDTHHEATAWLGPEDLAEEVNIALYASLRHRPIDPFRFLKKDR